MPQTPRFSRPLVQLLEALVADSRQWRHGYDLSRETGLKSGTLYPLLKRLEAVGILETRWGEPQAAGRPPRHLYRLTAGGRAYAATISEASRGKLAVAR